MIEYPYLLIRGKYFPIMPVTLINKDIEKEFFALIDSGSSISIFKPEVARQLNIDLEKGEKLLMEGVSGKISVYVHKIKIRVEDYEFTAKIAFSEEYTASLNILGRDSFFNHFLITFDENKRKIMLKRVK
ncbi:MAG: retropepsin-like aspartic protease [Candidatus Thermoplasmatota archaeon]